MSSCVSQHIDPFIVICAVDNHTNKESNVPHNSSFVEIKKKNTSRHPLIINSDCINEENLCRHISQKKKSQCLFLPLVQPFWEENKNGKLYCLKSFNKMPRQQSLHFVSTTRTVNLSKNPSFFFFFFCDLFFIRKENTVYILFYRHMSNCKSVGEKIQRQSLWEDKK